MRFFARRVVGQALSLAAGTYLISGAVKTFVGKSERVSVVVGVR